MSSRISPPPPLCPSLLCLLDPLKNLDCERKKRARGLDDAVFSERTIRCFPIHPGSSSSSAFSANLKKVEVVCRVGEEEGIGSGNGGWSELKRLDPNGDIVVNKIGGDGGSNYLSSSSSRLTSHGHSRVSRQGRQVLFYARLIHLRCNDYPSAKQV